MCWVSFEVEWFVDAEALGVGSLGDLDGRSGGSLVDCFLDAEWYARFLGGAECLYARSTYANAEKNKQGAIECLYDAFHFLPFLLILIMLICDALFSVYNA